MTIDESGGETGDEDEGRPKDRNSRNHQNSQWDTVWPRARYLLLSSS
jgi:hypothetical protein